AKRITPLFLAAPGTRPGGRRPPGPQETAEMWRTVASLERVPPQTKQQLGDALVERLDKVGVAGWVSLGRLAAAVPMYGPASGVVPKRVAEKWLDSLLALDWSKHPEHAAFAAAEIARCAGDRVRDLDDALRARVAERVRTTADGARLAEMVLAPVVLEAREERFAFGDALPVGLRLADLPAASESDLYPA